MVYKTPGKTSEYIRSLMGEEKDADLISALRFAQTNSIPVLLPETASFLKQLMMLKQPKKILEIGTAIGYSGLIMLKYSSPISKLFTIEFDEDSAAVANEFFLVGGFKDRFNIFKGDAGEILKYMDGSFDFIFLDGPKSQYIEYLPYLKKMLNSGGALLSDNVLFNGWVSGEKEMNVKKKSIVQKLDLFLRALYSDEQFVTSILPVGDGVSLSIKL